MRRDEVSKNKPWKPERETPKTDLQDDIKDEHQRRTSKTYDVWDTQVDMQLARREIIPSGHEIA